MISFPGGGEIWLIVLIALVVFGAGKLPQIGGNLGKAIKNFKSGIKETKVEGAEQKEQLEDKPSPPEKP
jgi:sec-independent protein translocase protein TatA